MRIRIRNKDGARGFIEWISDRNKCINMRFPPFRIITSDERF